MNNLIVTLFCCTLPFQVLLIQLPATAGCNEDGLCCEADGCYRGEAREGLEFNYDSNQVSWNPIDDAVLYRVEIVHLSTSEKWVYELSEQHLVSFENPLASGIYTFLIQAIDEKGTYILDYSEVAEL